MSMSKTYHPLVKGLLDGERSLADLPPELRAEAEEAERLLGAVDRTPVSLSPALAVGQHQYAFVVDGQRWVADPGAPAVDDGFGRRNSVVAVTAHAGRAL